MTLGVLLQESSMAKDKESLPFELPSMDSSFSSRSKDIFAGLDSLEKKHEEKVMVLDKSPEARREARKLWKEEPEVDRVVAESSKPFKEPFIPPRNICRGSRRYRRPANKTTPDYKIHPQKWTRYSLEDCDTSESSNCRAAFAFLEERRKLREAEERKDHGDSGTSSSGKFVFKKPTTVSGDVNSFSSRQSTTKRRKLDEVNIGHLDCDADCDSVNEESSKDTLHSDEQEKKGSSDVSAVSSFKKGNRKRSIRARENEEETE